MAYGLICDNPDCRKVIEGFPWLLGHGRISPGPSGVAAGPTDVPLSHMISVADPETGELRSAQVSAEPPGSHACSAECARALLVIWEAWEKNEAQVQLDSEKARMRERELAAEATAQEAEDARAAAEETAKAANGDADA